MEITTARVKSVLTRTSGYLKTVCSHSLQPYRGCSFGRSLCGWNFGFTSLFEVTDCPFGTTDADALDHYRPRCKVCLDKETFSQRDLAGSSAIL